jgi:hypothetical protein
MQQFRAHVRRGRLILDVPTDLPEGQEVVLTPVADEDDYDDQLDDVALQRELEVSVAEAKAGLFIDGDVVLAELRARRT